jgi:hypothetical protein
VQEYGVALLESMDRRQRAEAEDRQLRVMLVTSGALEPSQAFPEYFATDVEPKGAAAEDIVYDYSQVDFHSPSDGGGIEEFERMNQMLEQFKTISVHEEPSVARPEAPGQATGPVSMVPDDGEWI